MDKSNENGNVKIVPKKKLTVRELKEIEPKLEVYELNKYSRYLVTIKKSPLQMGNQNLPEKARAILSTLTSLEIPCAVLIGVDDDMKIMELDYEKG